MNSPLGLLTYYAKFLSNLSTVLAPWYKLLKHQEVWKWSTEQQKAFENSKVDGSSQLLVHFDPKLEIRLACDASAYDVGAMHLHRIPDGSGKPVGFASRTLTETEKKYSQMEKEAHVYMGVKHFHAYICWVIPVNLCCRRIISHYGLSSVNLKPYPSNRIQRWPWTLASYEYSIVCRKTGQHANADAMELAAVALHTRQDIPPREIGVNGQGPTECSNPPSSLPDSTI